MEVSDGSLGIGTYQTKVAERGMRHEMGAPSDYYYCDTLHAIAINDSEAEMGNVSSAVRSKKHLLQQPVPVVNGCNVNNSHRSSNTIDKINSGQTRPTTEETKVTRPPPKKKWIKEYLGKYFPKINSQKFK